MPTGYTHDVAEGKVITIKDFAMSCARAFGALISMRDEPMDAEIPEAFEVPTYYAEQVTKHEAKLHKLRSMSPAEAQAACQASHRAELRAWASRCDDRAMKLVRYQSMLQQVEAWAVPTLEHIELRDFMAEQIATSVKYDCEPWSGEQMPVLQRWPDWLRQQIAKAEWDVAYYRENRAKEVARMKSRNEWLSALRGSLSCAR